MSIYHEISKNFAICEFYQLHRYTAMLMTPLGITKMLEDPPPPAQKRVTNCQGQALFPDLRIFVQNLRIHDLS